MNLLGSFEHCVQLVWWDADSGVGDGKLDLARSPRLLVADNQDNFAGVGKLDRVPQQVDDYLPKPRGVADEVDVGSGRELAQKADMFLRGL